MENNKRAELGWVIFDWANSSYSLVISTAIFPTFFIASTPNTIQLGNFQFTNSSLYAFAVTFSYLLICLLSPVLSGIADYGGRRKYFMRLFTTIGSLSCIGLYFFTGESSLWVGLVGFIIATAGHAGSIVFYDSYLSHLVPIERRDAVSAKGYAYGYVGSVILLIINLAMIQFPEKFGFETNSTIPVRVAFMSVGIWWLGFAQLSFRWLPKDVNLKQPTQMFSKGLNELKKAIHVANDNKDIKYFLISFLCYSAGVQTVIYLASAFAKKELGFDTTALIVIILLLQLVAIVGAVFFARVSKWTNNLFSMNIMIVIWIAICVLAYLVKDQLQFYLIAALVGLVLGGIQAISRSSYSKIIPQNSEFTTSLYSIYDVLYYISIVAGTFLFGLVDQLTGNMRYSVLCLGLFFITGLILLQKVDKKYFLK